MQRKVLLAVAILLFPGAVAVLARSVGGERSAREMWEIYHVLMQFLLMLVLMPLVSMLYGTALIGGEVEQRTLVYLTTRRLRRATVLLVRFAATWLVLSLLVALSLFVLHVCTTMRADPAGDWQPWQDLRGYLSVAPAGAAGFLAVFTTISLVFGRPLIVSTAYVVVFEVILSNLPVLARRLSIAHPLRQTMVQRIPNIQQLYEVPEGIVDIVYPAGQTGTWTLVTAVAVLLVVASALMTMRELVPARVSRD